VSGRTDHRAGGPGPGASRPLWSCQRWCRAGRALPEGLSPTRGCRWRRAAPDRPGSRGARRALPQGREDRSAARTAAPLTPAGPGWHPPGQDGSGGRSRGAGAPASPRRRRGRRSPPGPPWWARAGLPAAWWQGGLAWWEAVADDGWVTTPSRSDRHAVRLARLRTARLMVVGGVVLGLAAGLSLALFSDAGPLRVAGVLVLALNGVMLLALPAMLRTQPTDWRQRRRREPPWP
jgi:hypothetical protein